ncbi:MAG: hypothetical protein KBS98_03185 [Flavobacterium sp.]|nr:hypothetical protein [Candidatus Neoflavobacterium equi]
MMRKILCVGMLAFTVFSFAQKRVQLSSQQLVINPLKAQTFWYGFELDDEVEVVMRVADGSQMPEISLMSYPKEVLLKRNEKKKTIKESVKIHKKGVYFIEVKNMFKDKVAVELELYRKPKTKDTQRFDTSVRWVKEQQTQIKKVEETVTVGYDTTLVFVPEKVVVSQKKQEELLLDKTLRVPAYTTFDSNKTAVFLSLPEPVDTELESKKVVAWAYWVGVGKESNDFWNQNRKMIVGAVQGTATIFTTPLGGIAAGLVTNMALPTQGEDVKYALVDQKNKNLFMEGKDFVHQDYGVGIASYKRFTADKLMKGAYYVVLENDNLVQGIDVNVKVSAIVEHIKYKNIQKRVAQIAPLKQTRIVEKPQIVEVEIPVTSDYK